METKGSPWLRGQGEAAWGLGRSSEGAWWVLRKREVSWGLKHIICLSPLLCSECASCVEYADMRVHVTAEGQRRAPEEVARGGRQVSCSIALFLFL